MQGKASCSLTSFQGNRQHLHPASPPDTSPIAAADLRGQAQILGPAISPRPNARRHVAAADDSIHVAPRSADRDVASRPPAYKPALPSFAKSLRWLVSYPRGEGAIVAKLQRRR